MQIEVPVANKRGLRYVRADLGLSQQRLAELAELTVPTILRAEKGETILLLTATAILHALNAVRAERDLPPLGLSDVEWTVQGE